MTASLPPPRNGDQPLERLPTSWTGYQPTGTDQVLPVFGAGPAGIWCRSCCFLAQVRKQLGDPRRKTASYSLPVVQDPKQKTDLHRSARGPAPEVCGTCARSIWDLRHRYVMGALRANLCSDGTVVALPILSRRGGGCVAGKSVQRRDCGGAADPFAEGWRVRCGQICAATGLWWR